MCRNHTFLYTNNEISEIETKELIEFTIATKRIKHWGINISKESEELYTETIRQWLKKFRDNINRWRGIPWSLVGEINIVKVTVLPKVIYRFIAIPIKLSMAFFTEQKISQFIQKHKRPWIAKEILRKKTGAWGINLPDFRLLYSYIQQDSMVLAQKQMYRPMEQDGKPRDKPTHLWAPYLWWRRQEYTTGKR